MPKVNTFNYATIASWNGTQDLFVVEQPDGTKVATPAMVKQFIEAGDFVATGEIEDGHGNILKDMAKSSEIGDLSQTGLTGDSVADQLGTAKGQIADVTSGIENITRKSLSANDENAFLTLAYADILSDMGAFVAEAPKCVTRIYTWMGYDHYIIMAYRIQTRWIYSFCFTEGKAYYITYDCNNNSIVIKKSFTLT
jgi:hypothetical protein